jgi:uncharacterized protein YndB with AHSA1/START domain
VTANLATFINRYTMKHVRVYPHPIDRVWDAITDDKHVSKWFGFPVRFDLKVGGQCSWGPERNVFYQTVITELDPKTLVVHTNDDGYQRFELSDHSGGCRFDYVQHFFPGKGIVPEQPDMPGSDSPGGPDTPWHPNFVGGFHAMWDNLGNYLDGAPLERGQEPSSRFVREVIDNWLWRQTNFEGLSEETAAEYKRQLYGTTRWNELNQIYREHIRNTIPTE